MCDTAAAPAKIQGATDRILSDLKLARFKPPRRYPRDFTFYVADPISSVLQIAFDAVALSVCLIGNNYPGRWKQ
jgi:hypothetical protein